MDVLQLKERIQSDIELGESHYREFKSALEGSPDNRKPRDARSLAKDIGETLVAFSNADGGELLVGVEDDGVVTGVKYGEETIIKLLEAPKNYVHPNTPLNNSTARRITLDNKDILYFVVEKGTRYIHLTSEGKCLQRRDRQNTPVSIEQLQFERQEQISREYDRHFVDGAKACSEPRKLDRKVSSIKLSPIKGRKHYHDQTTQFYARIQSPSRPGSPEWG